MPKKWVLGICEMSFGTLWNEFLAFAKPIWSIFTKMLTFSSNIPSKMGKYVQFFGILNEFVSLFKTNKAKLMKRWDFLVSKHEFCHRWNEFCHRWNEFCHRWNEFCLRWNEFQPFWVKWVSGKTHKKKAWTDLLLWYFAFFLILGWLANNILTTIYSE